ncbi:Unknown protein [Striga hermonthica]|uniref:F-box domain-containing protein n=1 Tax=Striga hermonthica TaxID=68872 RepID=A0A9N7R114_STRHE|nr:Unknown protein [Striga hermonthica]
MAKFPSSIFRRMQSSAPRHRPRSVEVEAADGDNQADNLLSLPNDLLFKILLNLSAQDIYYRASRVCRTLYYHTIRSEEFVNLHLRQTDEYGLLFRIIYAPTREFIDIDQYSSQRMVFVSMKQGRVTVSDYNYACKSRIMFESSCNGLIPEYNFWDPSSNVHLANPVTGRALQLPPFPKNAKSTFYRVGYAEASKAYKVALVQTDGGRDARWAILTVGVDSWWRHLATNHLNGSTLGQLVVTEGFIHSIFQDTILTLNVETEVMIETSARVPVQYHPTKYMKWYLSTGKALTVVVRVEDGVFRVWEMVMSGDYYYWREWERPIVLGNQLQEIVDDKYRFTIQPVGWLQQMEVLVFKVSSRNEPCKVFYVVIATGEIGWITPISSNKEWSIEEFYKIYDPVVPHRNTLVELEGYC